VECCEWLGPHYRRELAGVAVPDPYWAEVVFGEQQVSQMCREEQQLKFKKWKGNGYRKA
jgi:hypothetical protein